MSTRENREWMYKPRDNGFLSAEFSRQVHGFLDFAFSNERTVERKKTLSGTVFRIKCPCSGCRVVHYQERDEVHRHLLKRGFMPGYTTWYKHGESYEEVQHVGQTSYRDWDDSVDGCTQMVLDHMYPTKATHGWAEEDPNPNAKGFYDMLQDADEPLWEGCQNYSKLEAATRLLNWKSEYNVSEAAYNANLTIIKEMLPDGEKLVNNFYETKKMLNKLALPKERIHACKNHCMLFYKADYELTHCRVCKESRYKTGGRNRVPNLVLTYFPIAPRLQRLYMSKSTAKEMTWHHDHKTEDGVMEHPSDGKAWKHFNASHPSFAAEVRNVRLGLCTDGFNPNNSNTNPHSTWPVFITIYNLPPWLALKDSYVKLALVIPGKKSPGQNLDVFLRPLIDELNLLWHDGVVTYDAYRRNNFTLKAILLWTISDFPAYGMLSGWSTHGRLACPYCMGQVDSFQLQYGRKSCWFDCHRRWLPSRHQFRKDKKNFRAQKAIMSSVGPPPKLTGEEIWEQIRDLPTVYDGFPYGPRNKKITGFGVTHNWVKRSIFWELPYWRTLLIRHNLDVMHIEKNVFENVFNTIMNTSKTKDNIKARKDVAIYCDREPLHIIKRDNKDYKPQAAYTLDKDKVKLVCGWLKSLKFPDGYASNIGSCVNIEDGNFYSFKSHDCHVFMQRLLPIALKGMIPPSIWDAISELCTFFRVICSRKLHLNELKPLKTRIIEIICRLEKIFPPGFFDSMEHLVIHLAREAKLGGPVQYRWMYLYERKLGSLKRTIRNKARVEGSIVESYLVNELATYCSLYFDSNIQTRHNREPRNYVSDAPRFSGFDRNLSIFKVPGRRLFEKGGKHRYLTDDERHKAHTYILLNCKDVEPFISTFDDWIQQREPYIDEGGLDRARELEFAGWFKETVMGTSNNSNDHLKVLARGPRNRVLTYKGYFVNGYKFHTRSHGDGHVTFNSGVCVRGSCYNEFESDYYGVLDEVLEVEYSGVGRCAIVLFKCTWFDTNQGVRKDKHNLVEIKYKSRLRTDDPFILTSQAEQVYYTTYPSTSRELKDWWAVVKTKPRGIYEVAECADDVEDDDNVDDEHFFQLNEETGFSTAFTSINDVIEHVPLVAPGQYIAVNNNDKDDTDTEEEFQDTNTDSSEDDEEDIELSDG